MKARANFISRFAASLCGLSALAGSAAVWAEASPAYQDRIIGGGTLAPDISMGDADVSAGQGLARSLQIDGVVSALHSGSSDSATNVVENGIVLRSQWETVRYGTWSLDASARTGGSGLGPSEQGQGGVVTLRQRGMPFDGDWQADNALGDVNSPDISLARLQPRFYLPTSPMQGIATEWRGPSGIQFIAGGGVPGMYDGIVVPNFRTLDGSTATAGAQWSPTPQWTVGGQFVEARGVNLAIGQTIEGDW